MSFPLPPEFERAVLDRVASGQYASPDDVLRALVGALEEREEFLREIQQGLDDVERGDVVEHDEAVATMLTWLCDQDARDFVERKVGAGEYESVSTLLAAAIHGLMKSETDWDVEDLRRELRKGQDRLDRGEALTGDEAFELLRADRAQAGGDVEFATQQREAIRQRCGFPLSVWHRAFVDELVRSGQYASPREVLESALNVLREAEASDEDEALAELRREIDLGFESGDKDELIPGEEVEARILAGGGETPAEKLVLHPEGVPRF
jgi:Arc/MetJ-type ribon-helix-helix transcriptional regulator